MVDLDNIIAYFARHGTTKLNSSNCFRGNVDVPLDDKGIRDAHQLADVLRPIDFCLIACSEKQRARVTADIINKGRKIPIHSAPNLNALNVGDFSGLPRNEENTNELQYYIDNPEITIPGGESLNDFKARVQPCFAEIAEIAQNTGVPVLIVAHSSIIHELGSVLHGNHTQVLVQPGGVTAMYMKDSGDLSAEPIFKPVAKQTGERQADTVS